MLSGTIFDERTRSLSMQGVGEVIGVGDDPRGRHENW
jgi:hypothetical protein